MKRTFWLLKIVPVYRGCWFIKCRIKEGRLYCDSGKVCTCSQTTTGSHTLNMARTAYVNEPVISWESRARTHTHMHMHTHSHTRARAHTHTHTHTHVRTHVPALLHVHVLLCRCDRTEFRLTLLCPDVHQSPVSCHPPPPPP